MQFNLTGHKKLWLWLADHPDKDRDEWPEWDINGGNYPIPVNECFACEYDNEFDGDCEHCPLTFESCLEIGSLCDNWFRAKQAGDVEQVKAYALLIADTAVREGVETV